MDAMDTSTPETSAVDTAQEIADTATTREGLSETDDAGETTDTVDQVAASAESDNADPGKPDYATLEQRHQRLKEDVAKTRAAKKELHQTVEQLTARVSELEADILDRDTNELLKARGLMDNEKAVKVVKSFPDLASRKDMIDLIPEQIPPFSSFSPGPPQKLNGKNEIEPNNGVAVFRRRSPFSFSK